MALDLVDDPAQVAGAVPIRLVTESGLGAALAALPERERRWLHTTGFRGAPDTHVLLPGADGGLQGVWAGVRDGQDPWGLATLPRVLPPGDYRIDPRSIAADPFALAHAWQVGGQRFTRYRPWLRATPRLLLADDAAARRGRRAAEAVELARELVNTPAEDMGPQDLAAAVRRVAEAHGAQVREVVGDELLTQNFPAIHAVGRAAAPERAPRLIEMTWGDARHPRLTLVGKGVCFDSGGLDIKPADGMRWMKKDMGGAANALALADWLMKERLPVRLTLLIPAVENAISGHAMRPGDVFKARSGLHIEIGNTDAEGRVILCDALAYASESDPALLIDMATLTGAARIALGPDLPALFTRDKALGRMLTDRGEALGDPVWPLPLWAGYHPMIEGEISDIVNTGKGPKGGAITAALFLADFVPADVPWLHLDLYAWNDGSRPGRPMGGEMQAVRVLADWLIEKFGPAAALDA